MVENIFFRATSLMIKNRERSIIVKCKNSIYLKRFDAHSKRHPQLKNRIITFYNNAFLSDFYQILNGLDTLKQKNESLWLHIEKDNTLNSKISLQK